jgi:undecaprenyl pyrophosphate synthase
MYESGTISIGITLIPDFMKLRQLLQCRYGETSIKLTSLLRVCNDIGQVLVTLTTFTAAKFNREKVEIRFCSIDL